MKVLFLPSWYPHQFNYTEAIFIQRHAECVAKHTDAEVAVLFVLNRKPENEADYTCVCEFVNGVHTFIVYYEKANTLIGRILKYLKAYSIGWRKLLIQFGKPDINHVNVTMRAGIIAWWLKKFKSIPYIITEHWSGYDPVTGNYRGSVFKFCTRQIVKNSSVITAINQRIGRLMQQLRLRGRYEVVYNSVDTSLFKPSDFISDNKKCRFIHISNFKQEKNLTGILHVAKQLSLHRNDFTLLIIGGRTYLPEVLKMKNELQLDDELVSVRKKIPPAEVVKELQQSDVFLLFSHYEGFPCSLIEAWSCGLPALVTHVGGIPELMNDELGRMVEAADEAALLKQMSWMIDHHREFNRKNIRGFAVNHFDEKIIGQQFYSLYEEVLRTSSSKNS